MCKKSFGILVKAVVDIKKNIMVVDAAMHADEEKLLLENGSRQDDLWGVNLYPDEVGDNFIEFDSMINIRPRQQNYSRNVDDSNRRKQIIAII